MSDNRNPLTRFITMKRLNGWSDVLLYVNTDKRLWVLAFLNGRPHRVRPFPKKWPA